MRVKGPRAHSHTQTSTILILLRTGSLRLPFQVVVPSGPGQRAGATPAHAVRCSRVLRARQARAELLPGRVLGREPLDRDGLLANPVLFRGQTWRIVFAPNELAHLLLRGTEILGSIDTRDFQTLKF